MLDIADNHIEGTARNLLLYINCCFRKVHKELKQLMKKNKIDLVMREEELNGPMRFAADNLATQEECEELIKLANVRFFIFFDVSLFI